MNEVLTFDTHGLITNLTENGFAVRQAEALAKEIKNLLKNLATKTDLAQVETTLKADIARVETTLKADLKAGLAMVEGKIDRTKYDIIKWMAGLIVGAVGATSALIVSLINFL